MSRARHYGLDSLLLLSAFFMALARLQSMEALRYRALGEWGKLLGLDRVPEVRTMREKLHAPSQGDQRQKWGEALSKRWMHQDPDQASVLYVDRHVRVYHAAQTQFPKHHVTRQRLCLRATTDYWVNAMDGQPFFMVNQAVDPGLIEFIERDIVPLLDQQVPKQPGLLENQVVQRVTANNSGNRQTRSHWRYPGKDIGNFGENVLYRAEVALWGLGALPTTEAIYVSAIADAQGAVLQGANNCRFRIPPEGIPARTFWSLTLYEVDPFGGMYFTANPLKRYAVGDRTEGLEKNPDGSIDVWITHKQPVELDRQANWLPAPAGQFRLMIRAYAPSELFRSGQILPPAVESWTDG